MLIARLEEHGKPVLLIGLSAGNVRLLQDGRPIDRNLSELGASEFPFRLLVCYGETEQAIADEIKSGLHKAQAQVNETLRDATKELGLGPTGQYPQGRFSANDEGELRIGITAMGGRVVTLFGKGIEMLALTPVDARAWAAKLVEKAQEAES